MAVDDRTDTSTLPKWVKIGLLIFAVAVVLPSLVLLYGLTIAPFEGQVIDRQTGKPRAGASVLMAWQARMRFPVPDDLGIARVELFTTDELGRYHVPMMIVNPNPLIRRLAPEKAGELRGTLELAIRALRLVSLTSIRLEPDAVVYQFGY